MKDNLGKKALLPTTTDNYHYKHDNSSKILNTVVFLLAFGLECVDTIGILTL